MDAITLLKTDHKTVERLFKDFEKAGPKAYAAKLDIVGRIIAALAVHAAIEEQFFYPVTRETVGDIGDVVLESLEEHHIVKGVLAELDRMEPTAERFNAKVTVLIENVRHHVKEEESEYFPKVRIALSRSVLNDLGATMAAAKAAAPTHAHPHAPDAPPANLLVGAAAAVADRLGDTAVGVVEGGAAAIADLVARATGRAKPRASAPSAPKAKAEAKKVRQAVNDAADDVERAAANAKRTGKAAVAAARRRTEQTTAAARSGAKGTATSARKGAKNTATTAKRGATTTARTARSAAKAAAGRMRP